jgi:hypothetical protein
MPWKTTSHPTINPTTEASRLVSNQSVNQSINRSGSIPETGENGSMWEYPLLANDGYG